MDEDALLAQALWAAEQADVYGLACGSGDASDSDPDYGSSRKRTKRARTAVNANRSATSRAHSRSDAAPVLVAASTGAASVAADQQPPDAAAGSEVPETGGPPSLTASGRRRRKDSGQKKSKGQAWSATEEAAFLAGLETHGRNWKAIAADVASRDPKQVASRAQKHFIRLCMSGAALPDKVLESGPGYTLSGNLLDPHSAAAAACGFNHQLLLTRLVGEQLATALSGILPPEGQQPRTAAAAAVVAGTKDCGNAHDQPATSPTAQCMEPSTNSKPATVTSTLQQIKGGSDGCDEAARVTEILAAAAKPPLAVPGLGALTITTSAAGAAAAAVPGDECQTGRLQHVVPHTSSNQQVGSVAAQGEVPCTECVHGADREGPSTTGTHPAHHNTHPAVLATAASAAGPAHQSNSSSSSEYARRRPRRECASQRPLPLDLGSTSESLQLVAPLEFSGPVGTCAAGAQPYRVDVDLQALLVMDVHVHLSGCEVIGLLGGTWDACGRVLRVLQAYACRRAEGTADVTSVELDPAAEVEARGEMAAAGQRCVGWYHSHPVFEACPSLKDMDNQRNYQALTRDTTAMRPGGATSASAEGAGGDVLEPFVGFILSPYDPGLALPHTSVKAFVTQQRGRGALMPYNIKYGMTHGTTLPEGGLSECLRELLTSCRHDAARTDFNALWRPFTLLDASSGRCIGPWMTKLDKLLAALRWQCSYVQDTSAVERWLKSICCSIQELWDVRLRSLAGADS